MSNLEPAARVVRWGVESMAFNLGHIPADKLNWKPNPACKSALEVTGEVVGVLRGMQGVVEGGGFVGGGQYTAPASLEEAQRQLAEVGEAFAAALESAGPELDRAIETPFGTMWGSRMVLWGMIDLVHHHGQISYLQSLLGDPEMHFHP